MTWKADGPADRPDNWAVLESLGGKPREYRVVADRLTRRDAERIVAMETALAALLDDAERRHAGFPPPPEHWYAVRDAARAALRGDGEGR